jgi:hypothetical protein
MRQLRGFIIGVLWVMIVSPVWLMAEENGQWELTAEVSLNLLPDQTYLNPIVSADRNHIHLEARYNYEAVDTMSAFAGYNLSAGESTTVSLTPVIGGIAGDIDGIAPGFLFEFNYGKFTITSEGEYFFSTESNDSNFFYSWSEILYSPVEWFWFGAAGQRTRAYQTDLDLQRGIVAGFAKGNFYLSGYLMNPDSDSPFGIVTVGYEF